MESKNYKLIPFDIQRAKTPENPSGLEVVTESGKDVRIICTDRSSDYPIVGLMRPDSESIESLHTYKENGVAYAAEDDCLYLKEPILQPRRMTHKELSWWLIESPEEHREWKDLQGGFVENSYCYEECAQDDEVEDVLIRSNGGEWREPLIDEEDFEL